MFQISQYSETLVEQQQSQHMSAPCKRTLRSALCAENSRTAQSTVRASGKFASLDCRSVGTVSAHHGHQMSLTDVL